MAQNGDICHNLHYYETYTRIFPCMIDMVPKVFIEKYEIGIIKQIGLIVLVNSRPNGHVRCRIE